MPSRDAADEAPAPAAGGRRAADAAVARGGRGELAGAPPPARMDELKGLGRVRTATYRQLFAARITLREIDGRLSARGL